jgi:DNA polymerase-3 subunit alpha
MPTFSHLHVHTQYSLLDGAADIKALMKKAAADGMPAMAITDHGNMFGVFEFVKEAQKANIKPIVGCEFYLTDDRHKKQFTAQQRDKRYHQLLLAKNQTGYHNLSMLCSLGYIEGLYSKYPRIDKELIVKYHEGLIATTCCLGAEVPQAIMHKSVEEAEKLFLWWLDLFGEDYYVELQNHQLEEQKKVNATLIAFARKHGVKVIASNDSHYIDQADAVAQDILLCINTGELRSKPIGDGKGYRFGFANDQFYFKTQAEMNALFKDIPEAIDNTNEIVDKVTPPVIEQKTLLPNFPLPRPFTDANDYLHHLTYEGAQKRYGLLTPEIRSRIDFELKTISDMGFAGYFLVVGDFIGAARNMNVFVGPGRGSAAGSVVAYCIGITNIDPIKYNLLFERFLNPERVSMPDIDTDFDDAGRQQVIDYVVQKYGRTQVAQLITFNTLASKMSIKDVARVLELPLHEANDLTKKLPQRLGDKLNYSLHEAYEKVPELNIIYQAQDLKAETLKLAEKLEGSVRGTGIHAAGIIIAPDDITKYIPVCTNNDTDLFITQFEGNLIESAGMLKMDFLGLKTLSILRDALFNIKKRHGIEIKLDEIPLDDKKTFQLYQRGETIGTFQFESEAMRKYLRALVPTDIEDLIAMNALYRPGPMDNIPDYISRKHGRVKVEYPDPLLAPILKNTYGIMIYQEQIMKVAQVIGGYSLGGADILRKAMGKKEKEKMAKERTKFVNGAFALHQIDEKKANEIFDTMEKFAEYGFNRAHSAAYTVLSFQTGYLKANYPAEFMASVLSRSNDLVTTTFFIDECKRMGISVLGPDINESDALFSVNPQGQIRFGLQAIKGLGETAIASIIEERERNGPFTNLADVISRVQSRSLNRRSIESLVYAGALDCFEGIHRAQYMASLPGENITTIERMIKISNNKSNSSQSLMGSLFDDLPAEDKMIQIRYPVVEPWTSFEKLVREKEVTGIYLSGHPLDAFKLEVRRYCNCNLNNLDDYVDRNITFAAILVKSSHLISKNQRPFATLEFEDWSGTKTFRIFGEYYLRFKHLLVNGNMLYVEGRNKVNQYNQAVEFTYQNISLLQDMRNNLCKGITLRTDVNSINDNMISRLDDLLKKHPGIFPVSVEIRDISDTYLIMSSNEHRVSLDDAFIHACQNFSEFEILLN